MIVVKICFRSFLHLLIFPSIYNVREESSPTLDFTFLQAYTRVNSFILRVILEAKVYVLLCIFF